MSDIMPRPSGGRADSAKARADGAPYSYSPLQFAEDREMGLSTVFKRIREGRLRAVHDGGLTRILHFDAMAYDASLPAITPRRPRKQP
jgi:hypothetical protein